MREYNALHVVYLRARGVRCYTPAEKQQLERNERYIADQWAKAMGGVKPGRKIPERKTNA